MSTLMSPTMPSLPKSCEVPRDSQMMLELIWAPDSTVLNGIDLDVGRDVGLLADHALVADRRALADGGARLDVAVLADDRAVEPWCRLPM